MLQLREKGNFFRDCYNKDKGLKCFKCNKFGHIAPNCPKKDDGPTEPVNKISSSKAYQKLIVIRGQKLIALADTGSALNILTEEGYNKIRKPALRNTLKVMRSFGGHLLKAVGCLDCVITIDDEEFNTFYVMRVKMEIDVILGQEFLDGVTATIKDGLVVIQRPVSHDIFKLTCTKTLRKASTLIQNVIPLSDNK